MDNIYEELHLEFMQIISNYYDGDIAKAANVAEQMIELVMEKIDEELTDAQ